MSKEPDPEKILLALRGWHTLGPWLATQPSLAEVRLALHLEKLREAGPPRKRLLERLLGREQTLERAALKEEFGV